MVFSWIEIGHLDSMDRGIDGVGRPGGIILHVWSAQALQPDSGTANIYCGVLARVNCALSARRPVAV